MAPELFGPWPEYSVFFVFAAVAGCALTAWQARRAGWPLGRLALVLAVTMLAAIAGAKLYAIAERGGGFHGIAWELGSSFRYAGGVAAAFVAMPLAARWLVPGLSLARLGDMSAVSTAFALLTAKAIWDRRPVERMA